MKYKWTQFMVWLVLLFPLVNMAEVPQRPDPPRLVNDFAGVLQQDQVQLLEESLVQFARETSTQVVVVTVTSLGGYDPADFAFRIGESWGVGQKDKNNGIVMLVKPKTAEEKGKVYIAVGYGLEGVIPDAVANGRIIDNEMIPRFYESDYFGGIMNGIRVIMDLTRGEYTADEYGHQTEGGGLKGEGIIFLLILLAVILSFMKGGSSRSFNTGSRNLPFWALLGMLNSRGRGGSWSDFSGGRGNFGGFGGGGGGFGGFGGGGFGGGGAGGSW